MEEFYRITVLLFCLPTIHVLVTILILQNNKESMRITTICEIRLPGDRKWPDTKIFYSFTLTSTLFWA